MISNLVLDTLFARRPKINYVSPPICGLIQSPTSSGAPAVSIEMISPLTPVHYFFDVECGLTWDPYPRAVCYNVYRSDAGSTTFLGIVECGDHQCLQVDPGCYAVTAITPDGETPFGQPICTEQHVPPTPGCTTPVTGLVITGDMISGFTLSWDAFPGATCYNVFKDGTEIFSCIPFQTIPLTQTGIEQCFVVTAIAPCGETPQGAPVCLPPSTIGTGLNAYWPLNEHLASPFESVYAPPAIDFSGNGENLPLVGTDAQSNTGLVDKAFFLGFSGGLTHPDDAFLGIGPGKSFTIVGWTKGLGYNFSSAIAYSKWDAVNKDYAIYTFSDGVTWQLKLTAFDLLGAPQTAIYLVPVAGHPNSTDWHFIAGGYDDALQQLWIQIDGNTVATAPCVGVRRTAAAFGIADIVNTGDIVPSGGALGNFDETAFWDRRLTTDELTLVRNTGLAGQPLSTLI